MVKILSGDVVLSQLEVATCLWQEPSRKRYDLEFAQAFEIEHKDWDKGIQGCEYLVGNKKFVDIDFLDGKTLKTFFDEYGDGLKLKTFSDGRKFLYRYEEVPTFDSDDRVWDSIDEFGVFYDGEGVNMINCRHGYRIPRINIYLRLRKADRDFLRWLLYIGCKSEHFPKTFD